MGYYRISLVFFLAVTTSIQQHMVAKQYVSFDAEHDSYELNPLLREALTALKALHSTVSENRFCTVRLKDNGGREIELVEQHTQIDHWWTIREYFVLFGSGAACFMFGLMIGNLSR